MTLKPCLLCRVKPKYTKEGPCHCLLHVEKDHQIIVYSTKSKAYVFDVWNTRPDGGEGERCNF
jgi:hypothetical protein